MVIYQKPNRELIISLSGFLLSLVTKDFLHYCTVAIFVLFGAIWGYKEITSGVNWFRKMLGVISLIFIVLYLLFTFFSFN